MPIGVRCSSVELPSKWKRTPNSLAAQKCIHLLLSHAHFVEVVPVADDLAGGCLYVGFVEDYCVCFLRGFTRRRIQIQLAFLFTLDDPSGDISRPRLDRGPWCLREANCYQKEEKRGYQSSFCFHRLCTRFRALLLAVTVNPDS